MDATLRIALLIDADNAPAAKIDLVLNELARHGVANVRRAYGNWKNPHLQGWERMLHPYAIQPMQQFAYSTGKNASDMAMVVDAMDLLHSGRFDAFAIVSSDADFTPLVMRLRSQNMRVFGFGDKKTPQPFVNACSTFLFLDGTAAADAGTTGTAAATKPKTAAELRQDTALVSLLRGAVDAAAGDDGWAHLGTVGQYINNKSSFESRNYGYSNLSSLVEASDLFELRKTGQIIHVRARPAKKSAKRAATPRKGAAAAD